MVQLHGDEQKTEPEWQSGELDLERELDNIIVLYQGFPIKLHYQTE
jgi:hypothetical protein